MTPSQDHASHNVTHTRVGHRGVGGDCESTQYGEKEEEKEEKEET